MENEKAKNHDSHAEFMADTALEILKGNKSILDINGVKEIIALYLLIPYITPDTFKLLAATTSFPKSRVIFVEGFLLKILY